MKKTNCPKENTREWALLVEKHNGQRAPAYQEWAITEDWPADIASKVEKEVGVEPEQENYSPNPHLASREIILQKSKTIIELKIKKLGNSNISYFEKAEAEFRELLEEMNNNTADIALHRFILAGDRMANKAGKWMKEFKNGEKEPTLDKLRQINEFIQSFSIIDEVKEEFFNDPAHIADFKVVDNISTKRKDIKNDFIALSRQALAEEFAPHFSKIEEQHRVEAERAFNETEKPGLKAKGYTKAELAEAKKEYISNIMSSKSQLIHYATVDYVNNMLLQTVDVGSAVAWMVNPKDMGNDIISLAVDQLDKADYEVQQKTIAVRNKLEKANDAFLKKVGKNADPAEQYAIFLVGDNRIMNRKEKGWVEFKNKYQNNKEVWDLYTVISEVVQEKDKLVPKWAKIGYGLPSINKGNLERSVSNGLMTTLKQGTIDHFKVRAEDTDFGSVNINTVEVVDGVKTKEVVVSESGKEREVIPVFYRQKIENEDLSKDILSSLLLDYNNSLNFKAKTETAVVLDVLKEVVSSGDIKQKSSFTKIKKVIMNTDREVTTKAIDSNIVKTLDHLIRHRIYGINVEGDPATAKVVGAIGNFSSILGMSLNHISAVTNVLQGATMSTVEAMGNSTGLFNIKNKANAIAKYHKDDVGIIGDIGQRVSKSKTNQLVELFNAFSEFNALDKRFVDNNRAKRLTEIGTLMGMQAMGEHYVQSVVMYSILDNIKVQNAKGQFLDSDFKVTEDRSKAISIDEAYTLNDDGELDLHPSVAKTDRTPGVGHDDMRKISQLIRRSNRDFYGNYDSSNKSAIQRNILGNQMFKMRGWMVSGIQKRWRGAGNIRTAPGELDLDRKSFNMEIDKFEEGTYVTTLRFLGGLKEGLTALKVQTVAENWNKLTDAEKGRIQTAISEAAFAVLALIAYGLAADGDDPEDVYMALYARRLYSELTTFANPIEGLRTLRSPAVGISTVEAGLQLVMQGAGDAYSIVTGGEAELYKSGRRKGETKLKRKIIKLLPVWKQLDRTAKESLDFLLQ